MIFPSTQAEIEIRDSTPILSKFGQYKARLIGDTIEKLYKTAEQDHYQPPAYFKSDIQPKPQKAGKYDRLTIIEEDPNEAFEIQVNQASPVMKAQKKS